MLGDIHDTSLIMALFCTINVSEGGGGRKEEREVVRGD